MRALLLGIWLVLVGLSAFLSLGQLAPLISVLAIIAGSLILLKL